MTSVESIFGKAVVVYNARAGRKAIDPAALDALVRGEYRDFEIAVTAGQADAIRIAQDAVKGGVKFLIAAGGDGTVHEVVNGMLTAGDSIDLVLGVIPVGSGCDFVRTFGLPAAPQDAVKHLSGRRLFPIDAGQVSYFHEGEKRSRYFANIAEAGLGAEVVRRAEKLPRSLGRVRYLVAFWMTLGRFKPGRGQVQLSKRTYEGPVTNLVVANAQFFGGGMRIAPKAHPGDGMFDVLVQKGTKRDYIAGITKVYKGEHLPSPAIKEFLDPSVEVATEKPLEVEADGEWLGTTPASFSIVPNAYSLKI